MLPIHLNFPLFSCPLDHVILTYNVKNRSAGLTQESYHLSLLGRNLDLATYPSKKKNTPASLPPLPPFLPSPECACHVMSCQKTTWWPGLDSPAHRERWRFLSVLARASLTYKKKKTITSAHVNESAIFVFLLCMSLRASLRKLCFPLIPIPTLLGKCFGGHGRCAAALLFRILVNPPLLYVLQHVQDQSHVLCGPFIFHDSLHGCMSCLWR